ncbi:MAG: hypothetical protein RLY40_660 [Pseudomonadota bacterium]|jgi:hypothetical protein
MLLKTDTLLSEKFFFTIKMIESAFDELGFDLNLDPDYSESLLAGYLYDLGQALKKQGVSNQTPLNTTLDLLENPQFIQSTLDGSYLNQDKIYLLKQSNTTLVTSSPIQLITTPPKTNRAVNDTKLDRHENSLSERQERYRQIADDYMIHYDWKPKGLKGSRGIGGSRRSKRSNEIKEPSTSFALTKFQREKASKTYNDKSGQKVEKKILHKPDNLMARNSGKQPNKSVILSGFTQPALTKPRNHQRGFIWNSSDLM